MGQTTPRMGSLDCGAFPSCSLSDWRYVLEWTKTTVKTLARTEMATELLTTSTTPSGERTSARCFRLPVPTALVSRPPSVSTTFTILEPESLLRLQATPQAATNTAAARAAGFALLDNQIDHQDAASRSRRQVDGLRIAASVSYDLLLLAIDSMRNSGVKGTVVVDDRRRDDGHVDDPESGRLTNKLPAAAFAEWRCERRNNISAHR